MDEVKPGETPAKPKRKRVKMVNIVNTHKFRSFHIAHGKIGPGQTGKIPLTLWESVQDVHPWLKRAERGDVI